METSAQTKNVARLETVDQVLASMPARFHPEACMNVTSSYQWNLSGRDARRFTVRVDKGTFRIEDGEDADADVIMDADSDTYLALVNGTMRGIIAIMTRKLRVRGSLSLAAKMDKIFV
jgi:putative sterol carrier protein